MGGWTGGEGFNEKPKKKIHILTGPGSGAGLWGSTKKNTKVTGVRLTNEIKPGPMDHQKPRTL